MLTLRRGWLVVPLPRQNNRIQQTRLCRVPALATAFDIITSSRNSQKSSLGDEFVLLSRGASVLMEIDVLQLTGKHFPDGN